jgi:hypothetical protein
MQDPSPSLLDRQFAVMRKFYLSLLLPLFMLLVQQGAAWHEIRHLDSGNTTTAASRTDSHHATGPDHEHDADSACATCLAFAQLSSVANTTIALPDLLSFGHTLAQCTQKPVVLANVPALRNRGPPISL